MGLGPVLDYWRARAEKSAPGAADWTQQELAQFYRVEWALTQSGISVETDRGVSDEGDPWFAFCRASDGEVVIHIAREGRTYLLAGFLSEQIQRGSDFGELVERVLMQHPAKAIDKRGRGNVVMHPATMLALLVSIAFLQSNEGKAETPADTPSEDAAARASTALPSGGSAGLRSAAATLTGSAITLAATFELAQAVTILRVADLMNETPADEQAGSQSGGLANTFGSHGGSHIMARSQLSSRPATDDGLTTDAAAHISTSHMAALAPAQGGVDALLEIMSKLWTMPDTASTAPIALTVSAAAALLARAADGLGHASLSQDDLQPTQRSGEGAGAASHASGSSSGVQISTAPTLTVSFPDTSDSLAQTVVKLGFADQAEFVLKTGGLNSPAELFALVRDLVSSIGDDDAVAGLGNSAILPSRSTYPDDGSIILAPIEGRSSANSRIEPSESKPTDSTSDTHAGASPVPVELDYTTVIKGNAITHDVLTATGHGAVSRAIAAYKDDVSKFTIAVDGKHVIFYSPEAITHSERTVVELWHFQDGSSVSLVGLSIDGHLPYSL